MIKDPIDDAWQMPPINSSLVMSILHVFDLPDDKKERKFFTVEPDDKVTEIIKRERKN